MRLAQLPVGMLATNCYLVADDAGRCAVIDPGSHTEKILKKAEEEGFTIEAILLTHGHFDHIYGCESLKELYPECKICIHHADEPCLNDTKFNLVGDFNGYLPEINADIVFDGNELLEIVPGVTVKVIHTPGHSKGSVCYTDFENGFMFSGDTLFCRTVGRTDFIGGDFDEMMTRNRIYSGFERHKHEETCNLFSKEVK